MLRDYAGVGFDTLTVFFRSPVTRVYERADRIGMPVVALRIEAGVAILLPVQRSTAAEASYAWGVR
jgi:hypothetical protein